MVNQVSIKEALVISLVSMTVVFLVLVLISLIIGLLKSMGEKEKNQASIKEDKPLKRDVVVESESEENKQELIAIISAAIACSMGIDVPDINIKSIKRTPQATTVWRETGKREQMMGKL